jgi:hypothetical protein
MPLPHFTNDEQYLINCVKSPTASTSASAYMWGYIVTGALIAGFSAWKEDTLLMLCAFVIVCGFRVYEERFQAKWVPLWKSIIEKYEYASATTGNPSIVDVVKSPDE